MVVDLEIRIMNNNSQMTHIIMNNSSQMTHIIMDSNNHTQVVEEVSLKAGEPKRTWHLE